MMCTDLLTAVLRDAALSRRLLRQSELDPSKVLRFPCDRSIGLHVVLTGPVYLHAERLPQPLLLHRGDIAVMARGCDHALSVRHELHGLEVELISVGTPPTSAQGGGAVLSGAYQFWQSPVHPLFSEIPPWTVIRADELPRLGALALLSNLLGDELRDTQPGRDIVLHGLLDVVFTFALRAIIERCANTQAGWSQAANDPKIGRVVALMHEDAAKSWTLDNLARASGLSRTTLAERFRTVMGETPLTYLRKLRMQRAMRLLEKDDRAVGSVAEAVGYQDAFSFSKVFKRTTGMSPKTFRERNEADLGKSSRFAGG